MVNGMNVDSQALTENSRCEEHTNERPVTQSEFEFVAPRGTGHQKTSGLLTSVHTIGVSCTIYHLATILNAADIQTDSDGNVPPVQQHQRRKNRARILFC